MKLDVVIVGVGGQGTLMASKIMGRLAVKQGLDVKVSEVHGMSQRGGNVITHVRFGKEVHAPLVTEGEADIILSFEAMEALRALPFLKPEGAIIVNTQRISPMPVIMGAREYPSDVMEKLKVAGPVVALDALAIATEHGATRSVNIVLLGAMARRLSIPKEDWLEAVEACVPAKTREINARAFLAGWDAETTTV